jgi:peptidoglycan L-alanyl-D-glutamate endopeptidase CwlK
MSHGLADPPAEPAVNTSLSCLAPRFSDALAAMIRQFTEAGYDPIVSESCRTSERQAWLFGFGREWDDGRGVVTQAETNTTTWHGYGLAVDVISKSRQWDAPADFWKALGKFARANALAWGGDWPRFQDRPHVQWGEPMRQAPSAHAAELLAAGGMVAVWREVGAV